MAMGLFRQLHKSAFWSQLLLGVVAILALPVPQAANEAEQNPIEQMLSLNELSLQQADIEQAHFIAQQQISIQVVKQAVIFCEFFAKSYPLQTVINPPIRAGPFA